MYFVSLHYSSSINYKHEGAGSEQGICPTLHLSARMLLLLYYMQLTIRQGTAMYQESRFDFFFFYFPTTKH